MHVFELTGQYLALDRLVDAGELSITDATARLAELDGAFEQKVEQIAYAIKNREAAQAGMEAAANALAIRMERCANEIDNLKRLLIHLLNVRDTKKVKCPYFNVTVTTNAPAVVIEDESAIPPEYWRVVPPVPASTVLDKNKVKEDAKEGVIVPGVKLVATQRVSIK